MTETNEIYNVAGNLNLARRHSMIYGVGRIAAFIPAVLALKNSVSHFSQWDSSERMLGAGFVIGFAGLYASAASAYNSAIRRVAQNRKILDELLEDKK